MDGIAGCRFSKLLNGTGAGSGFNLRDDGVPIVGKP